MAALYEFEDDEVSLQSVNKMTKNVIEEVFYKSIDKRYVGVGADAREIEYSTLQLMNIQRIVNPSLRYNYEQKKAKMKSYNKRRGFVCEDIGDLRSSSKDVMTKQILGGKLDFDEDVNEYILFHGTLKKNLDSIISCGLDPRFSDKSSMFGPGVYFAEMSSKADQYADEKGNRKPNGAKLYMFLVRVLMGDVFVCDDCDEFSEGKKNRKFKGPPSMCCMRNKCVCGDNVYFDSVLGDGEWLFREFVAFEKSQIYPEFLITYKRV